MGVTITPGQGNAVTISAEMIRDALLSLPDDKRMFIISNPKTGEHRVFELHRNASNNVEYDYEIEPES